jgi:cytochrome P450
MSRNDILSLLMSARDEAGEALTDVELRGELITLLTAGHETTATALTWALYWIHKRPSVRQPLFAELGSIRGGVTSGPSAFRMAIKRRLAEFPSPTAPHSSLVA